MHMRVKAARIYTRKRSRFARYSSPERCNSLLALHASVSKAEKLVSKKVSVEFNDPLAEADLGMFSM